MTYSATLTSKQQLTIPSKLFRKLGWKQGQKVHITEENGKVTIENYMDIINRLAGSVKLPKRFKGLSEDEIIEKATKEYFSDEKNI